jgi:hypothetical protein
MYYWNQGNDLFIFAVWPDAEDMDIAVLDVYMSTANSLCVAYAPALPLDADIPDAYKLAEVYQARHLWSQARGGNRDQFDQDGNVVPVYPLVFAARDLLRPKTNPLGRLR